MTRRSRPPRGARGAPRAHSAPGGSGRAAGTSNEPRGRVPAASPDRAARVVPTSFAGRLVTALVGMATLGVYLATLSPTIGGGDGGELVTVGYVLGVAHPPGFPLYTLLAKLATLLPVGTVAWRVNLLSAVCAAAAAMLLCRAVRQW